MKRRHFLKTAIGLLCLPAVVKAASTPAVTAIGIKTTPAAIPEPRFKIIDGVEVQSVTICFKKWEDVTLALIDNQA